ncbi:MAG TPA: hypothetical protein VFN10_09600 [Thermoanaerobaculia bacterium]|nr:hypothetical protein [Thermoanaerobaculia bacterium]
MRRLLVPLLLFAFPALAQLRTGAEHAVSAPVLAPAHGLADVTATSLDAASNGTIGLIVWEDGRTGASTDIFAARVNSNGEVLDPAGIPLALTPSANESGPHVVWLEMAERFLVTWTSTDALGVKSVMVTEVGADGTFDEANAVANGTAGEIATHTTPFGDKTLAIVQQSVNGFLTWTDVGFLTPTSFTPTIEAMTAFQPHLARLGSGFVMIFIARGATTDEAFMQRFDEFGHEDGPVTRIASLALPLGVEALAIGTSASDAVAVSGGRDGVAVVRIHPDGTVTPQTGLAARTGFHTPMDVIEREDGYEVLRTFKTTLLLARFIGNELFSESDFTTNARAARGLRLGKRTLLVFDSFNGQFAPAIWGQFDGTFTPFAISRAAANQQMPALASNGNNALAVWIENRAPGKDAVMATLLARDGTPIGTPITIAEAERVAKSPAVTWDGASYVIVWQETRGTSEAVVARRLSANGTLSDPFDLSLHASNDAAPRIASSGTNAFAVWSEATSVHAALLTSGAVIPVTVEGRSAADVTWDGEVYRVVAQTTSGLRGARFTREGTPLGAFDISTTPAQRPAIDGQLVVYERASGVFGWINGHEFAIAAGGANPRVAFYGGSYLVTWQRGSDVFLARVYANGTLSPPVLITNGTTPVVTRGLLGYARITPEAAYVQRVFTRSVVWPKSHAVRH